MSAVVGQALKQAPPSPFSFLRLLLLLAMTFGTSCVKEGRWLLRKGQQLCESLSPAIVAPVPGGHWRGVLTLPQSLSASGVGLHGQGFSTLSGGRPRKESEADGLGRPVW